MTDTSPEIAEMVRARLMALSGGKVGEPQLRAEDVSAGYSWGRRRTR